MQQSGAIIISTLRRTWRDINTPSFGPDTTLFIGILHTQPVI